MLRYTAPTSNSLLATNGCQHLQAAGWRLEFAALTRTTIPIWLRLEDLSVRLL